MRKIKFRGKSVKTGEWLYGFLQEYQEQHSKKLCVCVASVKTWKDALLYEVIPETVGQFTGMTDKNNMFEIYEGDIVSFVIGEDLDDETRNYSRLHIVEWRDCGFVLHDFTLDEIHNNHSVRYTLPMSDKWKYRLSVVSNIHDNPILVKGGTQ